MGMLGIGLICNLLIKPLDPKWFMTDDELNREKQLANERNAPAGELHSSDSSVTSAAVLLAAWLVVALPMAWGGYRAILSVSKFIN